ncbi:pol ii transcription elongation factor subunit cdc73 [Stagonosporopsis vannaccii]|nr:pol ii transcription elongation factor subunit cdc73 [Stagonosporopsis vannaccii]
MAQAAQTEIEDPLYNLRLSIKASATPVLSTSAEPTPADYIDDLARATHITFNVDDAHRTFALTSDTRFAPDGKAIDLRSCYFAWANKDASVTDYFAAVTTLNEELPGGAGGSVQNLTFAQKIELIAWLSGETESSDSIAPIDSGAAAAAAGDAAAIAGGKGVPVDRNMKSTQGGMVDARLLQIYDGERTMGDHNTVLRGNKPIDFSPYRKAAAAFFRNRPDSHKPSAPQPALVSNLTKKPHQKVQPIILLSPSASSLLRTSNIKSFLDDGVFIPPNAADTTSANMIQIRRHLPTISQHPITFILVDSTTSFKPTYWSRVVAVFTTGQTWQFKSYKYPNPAELFSHYPGVYVGWQGDETPQSIVDLGRGVLSAKVDKWTGSEKGRWRDKEVVERIWGRIEEGMRRAGWTREGPGLAGQQPSR